MKGVAVLEVGVGERKRRGVFRFLRDGYQAFVSDAVVVKPFALGRYRIVPSCEDGRHFWFLVERVGSGSGIGYIGEGVEGVENVEGVEGGEIGEGYELGYVVLGYGIDGSVLRNRSVAVSELWHSMLLLPHCEFEVKESEGL